MLTDKTGLFIISDRGWKYWKNLGGIIMGNADKWKKELKLFEKGKSSYQWDEIEELVTDEFEDGYLTSEEFDSIMGKLMELDCG